MRKTHSNLYLYNANVNPIHVWSLGFIADGKNGIVRILNYTRD